MTSAKSVIVGTAGHIDHGKTSLVKALTGMDADRLEEEKRRGITIDLGFASLELPMPAGGDVLRLGFVDVPGHERFVRNMLAGIGGIDVVLLVVAANEGIMPQTREHLDICRLLGIRRGITVLTKSDLVDAETLDVVRMEVEEFLRGTFLDATQAPVIAVSTVTGAGIAELKLTLARVASQALAKDAAAFVRLPIDRVFTMKGFGTVVTGTLITGTIAAAGSQSELEVFPALAGSPQRVRVRGVQVHGGSAAEARAGERTALNLAGVSVEQLARGMMLATPDALVASQRIDARLHLLSSAKPLKHRAKVHFHAYAGEQIAEVYVQGDVKCVVPGGKALVQLRLAAPVLLLPGDHFILRQFSPMVTIGGGEVVDAHPLAKSAKSAVSSKGASKGASKAEAARWREILASGSAEEKLGARIARRGRDGLSLAQAVAETGLRREPLEQLAATLVEARSAVRTNDLFLDAQEFKQLAEEMLKTVWAFHAANPLVAGMGRGELEEKLRAAREVFAFTLAALVRAGKLGQTGEAVHVAGRSVQMKDDETEARAEIERGFASAGLQVPALKEVFAGLKVDLVRAQKIVTLMLRQKTLVKVSEELVFHGKALEELRARVLGLKSTAGSAQTSPVRLDVARFKELTGVSRKYAIPLLEWLDRERVTRRVGDARELL